MITVAKIIETLGGPTEAAAKLGIKWPSTITNWIARDQIPVDRIPDIELASGRQLKCEQMCSSVEWRRDRSGHVTGYTVKIRAA